MKIAVFVARYAITGVPLAQTRMATAFAARGHEVDFVIGFVADGFAVPDIEGVNTVVFGEPKVRSMFVKILRYLKYQKPDVIFSAEDHLNALVLISATLTRSKAKISGSSRVTPFDTYSDQILSKRWFLKQIMRLFMRRADVLTCVSKDMVTQYRSLFRNSPHVCVYNIVDTPSAYDRIAEPVDHPWFNDKSIPCLVAAGQLGPWKGFEDLIKAVALVSVNKPVRLSIFGEGPQRGELQTLIDSLSLTASVKLEGNVVNPLKYFARADVFVLSSLLEGMPNVLIEAMMAGCTPVATDCPTGPREILESGQYGYLVPMKDPEALAAGIESAILNQIPAERLAKAIKPFREETVVAEHFRLLGL